MSGARLALFSLLASGALACQSQPRTIEAGDNHTEFPVGRVTIGLEPDSSGDGESARNATWLCLEVTRARGDSTQTLGPTDTIVHKGVDFDGPGTVAIEYELALASGWVAAGGRLGSGFRGSLQLGLSLLDRELELAGVGAQQSSVDLFLLPLLGVQLDFEPVERVSLYTRYMLACDVEDELAPVLRMFDAGLRLQPHDHLAVFAGWRDWRYDEERHFESDIDIDVEGLALGVELVF